MQRAANSTGAGRGMLRACIALLGLGVLLASCNLGPGQAASMETAARETRSTDAEGAPNGLFRIPCFQCHAPERFRDREIFPHDEHRAMGLHCNQCHLVKAHRSITLNGQTCTSCHNLGVIRLSNTPMPATFDHAAHAAMFGCNDCHRDTFRMKAGAATMDMQSIAEGRYCGACHNGRRASAPEDCNSCHAGA